MKIDLDINGFLSRVEVIPQQINEVYKPILKKIEQLYRRKTNSNRIKVLLAGPPGSGKSTFSKILELLAPKEISLSIQSLSLDGFHYPNDYLNSNFSNSNGEKIKLRNIKGAPETYDIESLLSRWDNIDKSNISWPVYDRNLHDLSPEEISIESEVIILEGNWVLLDEDRWRCLSKQSDLNIFLKSDEIQVRERLKSRKLRGGFKNEEVEAHYQRTDRPNVNLVLNNSLNADLELVWLDGTDPPQLQLNPTPLLEVV